MAEEQMPVWFFFAGPQNKKKIPVILKAARTKELAGEGIYKLLNGHYSTLRRKNKKKRFLLKKQNNVLAYYEEDKLQSVTEVVIIKAEETNTPTHTE